jgi:hypothetical protein
VNTGSGVVVINGGMELVRRVAAIGHFLNRPHSSAIKIMEEGNLTRLSLHILKYVNILHNIPNYLGRSKTRVLEQFFPAPTQ